MPDPFISLQVTVSENKPTIPSPGRSNEITTPGMINKIHGIVLNDPKGESA